MQKVGWAGERSSLVVNGGRFLDYSASQKLKIANYIAVSMAKVGRCFPNGLLGKKMTVREEREKVSQNPCITNSKAKMRWNWFWERMT